MASKTQYPIRNKEFTHKLLYGSKLISKFPKNAENALSRLDIKEITKDDKNVLILEDYIGFKGLYARITFENQTYYTLRENLKVLEDVQVQFAQANVNLILDSGKSVIDELPVLTDWMSFPRNKVQYDTRGFYYIVVEKEYDGEGLPDYLKQKNNEESYYEGLQQIFKSTGKRYKLDYVKSIADKYYFFGIVSDSNIQARNCTNFYSLVLLDKKYLEIPEIIDYRTDKISAIRDGISTAATADNISAEDIKEYAQYRFFNYYDFEAQITDLYNILNTWADKQDIDAATKADEFIGAITPERYKELIGIDLRTEKEVFNPQNENGLAQTIRFILEMNNIDYYTDYKPADPQAPGAEAAASENNILFGFDQEYNIVYMDIIRNNEQKPILITGNAFYENIGMGGLRSKRYGFLLYNYCYQKIQQSTGQDVNMTVDRFLSLFIIPSPNEVNLPKRTYDCAKSNLKKLAEDLEIKALRTGRIAAQVAEANYKATVARLNADAANLYDYKDSNNYSMAYGVRDGGRSSGEDAAGSGGDSKNSIKGLDKAQLKKLLKLMFRAASADNINGMTKTESKNYAIDIYIDYFLEAQKLAKIDTPLRLAGFMAQSGVESQGWTDMTEDGDSNYFKKYDPPSNVAKNLGNIYPGDGERFKGRGPIHLTGRDNYTRFTAWARRNYSDAPDFVEKPDIVADNPKWGFRAAAWYWINREVNKKLERSGGDIKAASFAVNGGSNGLPERIRTYKKNMKILESFDAGDAQEESQKQEQPQQQSLAEAEQPKTTQPEVARASSKESSRTGTSAIVAAARAVRGAASEGASIAAGGASDAFDELKRRADYQSPGQFALKSVKKALRSTALQKAILKAIICQLKDVDNQSATGFLKGFDTETRNKIQKNFKDIFCSKWMELLLKALATYEVPEFRPIDLNRAMRNAIRDALVQLAVESYEYVIKQILEWIAKCDKKDPTNPFNANETLNLDNALNDLLDNSSDPTANQGLANTYDALGAPKTPIGDQNPDNATGARQATDEQKKAIKNLIADAACLLTAREICQLMAEGSMEDEVFAIISSLIERKYPEISKQIRSREQILTLFGSIGEAINIIDICKTLAALPPSNQEIVCDDGSIEKRSRDTLAKNGLTPDQIDDYIKDQRDKKQKRLDDLINGLAGDPQKDLQKLPILCKNGVPGIVNPAKVDETYAEMFKDFLEASLEPLYEAFKDDAKNWSSNFEDKQIIEPTPELISTLKKLNTSGNANDKEAIKKMRDIFIAQGILKPVFLQDPETGKTLFKEIDGVNVPVQKKDDNDELVYEFANPGSTAGGGASSSPIPKVSPTLQNSIARQDFFEIPAVTKDNKIVFRVNTDKERDQFKSIAALEVALGREAEIEALSRNIMAELYMLVTYEIVSSITEAVAVYTTGGADDDVEFWVGFESVGGSNGLTVWVTNVIRSISLLFNLLDIWIKDATNRPVDSQAITNPPILQESLASVRAESARKIASRRIQQDPSLRGAADNSDRIGVLYANNTPVAVITEEDVIYAAADYVNKINKAAELEGRAKAESEAYVARETFKLAAQQAFDPNAQTLGDIDKGIINATQTATAAAVVEGQPEEIQLMTEEAQRLRQDAETNAQIGRELLSRPLSTTVFFTKTVDPAIAEIKNSFAPFERSIIMGPVIRTFEKIMSLVDRLNAGIQEIDAKRDKIDATLKNIDNTFPNYEISYTYGEQPNIPESVFKTEFSLKIDKNNKEFMSINGYEELDEEIKKYIEENDLDRGFDGTTSAQRHIFNAYIAKKSASGSYKNIEKQFMDKTIAELKNSIYFKYSKKNNQSYTRKIQLNELPTSDYDAFCGIKNGPLDLDEIKEDIKKSFAEDACNFEDPNPTGGRRNSMNPIEKNVSDAFILATFRVYLYDYYLKGIFLFDKYRIGMTATSPMLEFLALSFEMEMKAIEFSYFNNFFESVVNYYDRKNKEKAREYIRKYGSEGVKTQAIKKEKFKEVLKQELLYISNKFFYKIEKSLKTIIEEQTNEGQSEDIADLNDKLNYSEYGKIFEFFDQNKQGDKDLKVLLNNGIVTVQLNGNILFTAAADEDLKNNPEYRLLFEFCFPIRKYISLVTIESMMANNARLKSAKAFLITKTMMKARHNQLMNAPGYKDVKDLSSKTTSELNFGSGKDPNSADIFREMIIRLIVKTPWRILKGVAEVGDPNVFLSSLLYNLTKPFSLAFLNELPFKKEAPYTPLFLTTPIIGAILPFCWIPPTNIGIFYYMLGCWVDEDWFENDTEDFDKTLPSERDVEGINDRLNLTKDFCKVANLSKQMNRNNVNRRTLLITEYN